MITLVNPKKTPINIVYNSGTKVFRKQILPGNIVALKGLDNLSQIVNLQSLINQGATVYNYDNNTFANAGSFTTSFYGANTVTGLTLEVNSSYTTGWTFVTSANTLMANNVITATTVGNSIRVGFSGTGVSTNAWYNAISTTAFSAMGFTVGHKSTTTFIESGGTNTISVSASTIVGTGIGKFMFVGDNIKPSEAISFGASSLAAGYLALNSLI